MLKALVLAVALAFAVSAQAQTAVDQQYSLVASTYATDASGQVVSVAHAFSPPTTFTLCNHARNSFLATQTTSPRVYHIAYCTPV